MKIKLKHKLIYAYTILISLLIIILVYTSSKVFTDKFIQYVAINQENEMENVVNDVTKLYADGKTPTYDELFAIGVDALDNGLILMVNTSADNQILCMSEILVDESDDMLKKMEGRLQVAFPHFKGEYQENMYDLEIDGENNGFITIGYFGPIYYTEFDVIFLEAVRNSIYTIGTIFFIISGIIVYLLARKLSDPLEEISKRATDIGNGDYENNFELKSSTDEIQKLINSINLLSEKLNAQKQVKKQLAINYAHEIRTPITCVLTTLEGMQDGVFEVTNERLDSLYSEVSHISKLIKDIDILVDSNTSDINLKLSDFDLGNLVKICIDNFQSSFENKNISLLFEKGLIDDDTINADEEKIKSVIGNLLSNALKYTDENGKVYVSVNKYDNYFVIKIKDTGIGIEKKEKNLIFEELYRVEKSRVKDVDGFGVGLSICKNILEAHGGEITVNSVLGKGSEFIVTIPCEQIKN